MNVSFLDERGELSAIHKGIAENDLGIRTDVLSNINKTKGIEMLIRSMAPKIIFADEIGNENDYKAINYAICSGVKGIFTAHGNNIEYLKSNPIFNKMLNLKLFERIIFLDDRKKCKIKNVYMEN